MDMDQEYANAAFIPGSDALPRLWAAQAATFRQSQRGQARLDLPYGPAPQHRLDLFMPMAKPKGVLVFVHGGYWMDFGRKDWSHLAAGAVAQGWACAIPSYTLAPDARIRQITAEIETACLVAAAEVSGPLVVTGHSAGGHLAARMGCTDRHPTLQTRLGRVVPISPLADLEPLLQTEMNATLWLDAEEVETESPARHALSCQAHVWVGGNERPAFLWQARTLSENWACDWTVEAGKHHFNVIDSLQHPDSALTQTCLAPEGLHAQD